MRKKPTFCQNLASLLLGDTLDLLKNAARSVGDGLDGVETAIDDELDVALGEAGNSLRTREKR